MIAIGEMPFRYSRATKIRLDIEAFESELAFESQQAMYCFIAAEMHKELRKALCDEVRNAAWKDVVRAESAERICRAFGAEHAARAVHLQERLKDARHLAYHSYLAGDFHVRDEYH